jgi:flavin-dependent dehydrogenase
MKEFDVVIIGAGPAGCHCARLLAKSGHQVLLVEQQENFENNNFSSAASSLEILEKFDLPQEVVGSVWQNLVIVTSNLSRTWNSSQPLGVVLNFAKLRNFLAQEVKKYGGEVWLGCRYIKYLQENNQTLVWLQPKRKQAIAVGAKVLVDATGFSRAVIYPQKKNRPNFLKGVGLEYLIEVEEEEYNRFSNNLTFLLGYKWMPQGYSWVFPMEFRFLKVGAAYINRDLKIANKPQPLKKYIQLLLSEYLQSNNYKIIDIHGSILEYSSGLKDIYYRNNIIAIGDAVSTVNFLGGEGIRHAMYGAEIAHNFIDQYLNNQLFNFQAYQRRMKRHFSRKWNLSEKISRQVYWQYHDAQFDSKVTALTVLKTEDLVDILFAYKFEKAYKVFGNYLKKKILSLILSLGNR